MSNEHPIAVLGAGSWGTAIAIHLARNGTPVYLWGRDLLHMQKLQKDRENVQYLPGVKFPDTLEVITDLAYCHQQPIDILLAIPSHAFEEIFLKLKPPVSGIAWLTKGLHPDSNFLLSEFVSKHWGAHYPVAIISGPSFAMEVARDFPTALTLASNNIFYQKKLQRIFHHDNLRIYTTTDLVGVQIAGSVKNVLAIACGISDGLGYGANARAALITRGLVEMRRLGIALGSKEETFNGLAGLGDLVLTCTDNQSRNRRFGILLGQGQSSDEAEKQIQQVVEGKKNAKQVETLALQHNIDMPICFQVSMVVNRQISPQQAVTNLMTRQPQVE